MKLIVTIPSRTPYITFSQLERGDVVTAFTDATRRPYLICGWGVEGLMALNLNTCFLHAAHLLQEILPATKAEFKLQ